MEVSDKWSEELVGKKHNFLNSSDRKKKREKARSEEGRMGEELEMLQDSPALSERLMKLLWRTLRCGELFLPRPSRITSLSSHSSL
tara:strand:- start:388 stop:645 length:258 start_codon:yes stop_codon:yes gene_type:complete